MEEKNKWEILFFFQKELKQLEEHYNVGGQIIWLTGREGIGKTTLVKYFAEKVGDYEYIDLKIATIGDDFHEKLKELISKRRLVILDNYDYRFEQNGYSFLEVSKLQKKLGETRSTVIVVSRKRLFMYPMFIYMASLLREHNFRIDMADINLKKIYRMFNKCYSIRGRVSVFGFIAEGEKKYRSSV